ncbi:MAG: 6-phosphogluconolactonase [Flavihumibacter sp.]
MKTFKKDKLTVQQYPSRQEMGKAAADTVAAKMNELLQKKEYINVIFASAPSQNEFLEHLRQLPVPFNRINAFHMDEYVGLHPDAPQGFGNFLKDRIFSHHPFRSVHYINGNHPDPQAECERYADLLTAFPTDIVLLGIGENTHLAFNDPHVAFFNDHEIVKVVDLDAACRHQQVNDGCFTTLEEVPTHAITITIPPLIRSTFAYAIVPGPAKAQAIFHTLTEPVQEHYPSTKLREHDHAILFIDDNSAAKLP